MDFSAYSSYFESIVNKEEQDQAAPYNKPDYYEYTKLNWARMSRWFKTQTLSPQFLETIKKIDKPQQWLLITEPWCGDAAHNVPFIIMAAQANPLISVSIELLDSAPHSIDNYLTNGTKSIPKLVIRDQNGNDLATWGPRPKECQVIYAKASEEKLPFQELTVRIHTWYNANKGVDVQEELSEVILQTI
ncbi:thioredoxin family protein [Emticicia sp. TH156]|uniref:thioredoxin family protein n=1 Tax=Emticicia sp. TH156 TaxID=2067454 RepID=UPI000C776A18|nr:thioredoxin family protein [Emticicia sp. TH156]PLK44526.1 thioredoxin family protein [Emticicia sp. TH156]